MKKTFILSCNDDLLHGREFVVDLATTKNETDIIKKIGEQVPGFTFSVRDLETFQYFYWHCHTHTFADFFTQPGPFYLCFCTHSV